MSELDRFLRGLKRAVDAELGYSYRAHGPLRISLSSFLDEKGKQRHAVTVDVQGKRVCVHSSPTGKELHVQTVGGVRIHGQGARD